MTSPARILIVDDDEGIREFLGEALSDEGHEVLMALHGAEALDVLGGTAVDLVLLDMRLPVVDGWEFANAFRRTSPHTPLIVMTAGPDAAAAAVEIHADGYLAKPFSLDSLLALVERHAGRIAGVDGCGGR